MKRKVRNAGILLLWMASVKDLPTLNQLIVRSKSFWKYSPDYLAESLPLLTIHQHYLQENFVATLIKVGEFLGVFSFVDQEGQGDVFLDHFWLDPQYIGLGWGRKM